MPVHVLFRVVIQQRGFYPDCANGPSHIGQSEVDPAEYYCLYLLPAHVYGLEPSHQSSEQS